MTQKKVFKDTDISYRSTTQHLLALVCARCPFLAHFPTSKFVGNDDHQHNTRVWWTIRLWFKNWWPQITPIISSITHVQGPYFLTGTRRACSSWDVSVSAWYIFLAYFLSSLDFWDIGMNRWLQSIRFLKYSQRRRSELCDVIIFQIRHPNWWPPSASCYTIKLCNYLNHYAYKPIYWSNS
jgi:hypothetical protein